MKEIRKIQDIAPLLAENFTNFEPNDEQWKSNGKFIESNKSVLGKYFKYLIQLHDSRIIETKKEKGDFIIKLNDFSHFIFANAIINKKNLNINKDRLEFPLLLKFRNAKYSLNNVTGEGIIEPIDFVKIDEFLYEQFLKIEDKKVEVAWIVWKKGKDEKPGKELLLLISASDFEVIEKQDKNWNKYFGNEFDSYLNLFKTEMENGKYLSDQSICEELIDNFDKK